MKHYFINFAYFQGSLCAKDNFSDDTVEKEFSLFCFFFPKKKKKEVNQNIMSTIITLTNIFGVS